MTKIKFHKNVYENWTKGFLSDDFDQRLDGLDDAGCGCKVGWVDVDAARLAALHAKPGLQKKQKQKNR